MHTEHIFVIWSCIRIKGEVSHEKNWFKFDAVVHLTIPMRFFCCSSSLSVSGLYVAFFFFFFCHYLFPTFPPFGASGGLCFVIVAFTKYLHLYSRTSLSRTRLFRITAYLEVKIWSLF